MIEIDISDRDSIEMIVANEPEGWISLRFEANGEPFLVIRGGRNMRRLAEFLRGTPSEGDKEFLQRFREYTAAERIKEQGGGKQPDLDAFVNHRYAPDPLAEPAVGRKMYVDVDSCSFDRVGDGYLRATDEEGNEIATFGPSMTTAMAKHALGVANRAYAIGCDVGAWRVRWEIRRAMGIDRENQ